MKETDGTESAGENVCGDVSVKDRPLAIDLFCGLGGWTEGLLSENYRVIGFDIEQHIYGEHRYLAQLVIQDVLTLHGSQFRGADLIVASPPCQEYSYMAMPWSRAKAKAAAIRADTTGAELERLTRLFRACFRIQREACEAAGRHIPMVVENVRGAQPWVGRARWSFGSFYLWGDVPALMPATKIIPKRAMDDLKYGQRKLLHSHLPVGNGPLGRNDGTEDGHKLSGFRFDGSGRSFQSASVAQSGVKCGGDWFNASQPSSISRMTSSKSPARKAASAMIAKIPETLSRHIARTFLPSDFRTQSAMDPAA